MLQKWDFRIFLSLWNLVSNPGISIFLFAFFNLGILLFFLLRNRNRILEILWIFQIFFCDILKSNPGTFENIFCSVLKDFWKLFLWFIQTSNPRILNSTFLNDFLYNVLLWDFWELIFRTFCSYLFRQVILGFLNPHFLMNFLVNRCETLRFLRPFLFRDIWNSKAAILEKLDLLWIFSRNFWIIV